MPKVSLAESSDTIVLTAAQSRVIAAAMELFARHGVAGTSLQMIADHIGVTKAAVYHQYHAKEDIVRAASDIELGRLETVIIAAEAQPDEAAARESALVGIVQLAVSRRKTVSTILTDPVIVESFHDDTTFQNVAGRLQRLLLPGARDDEAQIQTAMLIAAISGTVSNPFVRRFDDQTLSDHVLRLARRFLDLTDA